MNSVFSTKWWSLMTIAAVSSAIAGCSARQPVTPPPPPSSMVEPSYDGKSLSQWMQMLGDPNAKTRVGAAWAIGRMGPKAAPAVPELIAALNDSEKLVRTQSIATLGKIGPPAAAAIPTLDLLSQDNDWATRQLASAALAAIEGNSLPSDDAREKMPSHSRLQRHSQTM